MNKSGFSKKIIEWYKENKRDLPWRETKDPYPIWLSEIILQQTRVAQGLPYFHRFLEKFPSLQKLAAANEQEILRLWQGLGYYTRARNLHRCAKEIMQKLDGKFPNNFSDLKNLPGIGAYTAAAIASFAFLEAVAVVDGNVFRVIARVFGIDLDIASAAGQEYFSRKANELIPQGQPDLFNQAIMEFGATHCLPKNPKCGECIFKKPCIAYARDWQEKLPVKGKKIKTRRRHFYYLVIVHDKKLLMRRRSDNDIWTGLYDFPLIETKRPQKTETVMKNSELATALKQQFTIQNESRRFRHVLSHQILIAKFIFIRVNSPLKALREFKRERMKFYSRREIEKLPKPVLVSHYLSESGFLQ